MGKKVKSTIKRFPGSVTFHEPLTFPMVIAFEDAIADGVTLVNEGETRQSEYDYSLLPAICGCVEAWNLEGLGDLTPDNFPANPKISASKLVSWLVGEIVNMYTEGEEVPNE